MRLRPPLCRLMAHGYDRGERDRAARVLPGAFELNPALSDAQQALLPFQE